ncbi:MAG: diguanylate cyclase [Solirubrobacteraceae bacterium]|nr:diguanylate cyclase [Solirubrobacteraceae bacterium]
MLNLDGSSLEVVTPSRDPRMTLPGRPGEAPVEGLLGRRALALAPWVALAVVALAYGVSELLRAGPDGTDWGLAVTAFVLAAVSTVAASIQDTAFGIRHRRTLWIYAAFGTTTMLIVAGAAALDAGITSIVFAGTGPIAMYSALVVPPTWRLRVLGLLLAITLAVQLVTPASSWFDALVVSTLITGAWFSGVLASVAHARTAKIARRLTRYDAETRSLSRRGFMEGLEHLMSPMEGEDQPIALLLVGVDVVAAEAAGDDRERLLRWIGTAVPAHLPLGAEFGRLGDGELAVSMTGLTRAAAAQVADEIQRALAVRVPVTVGVATTESRSSVAAADLFRVADAARADAVREGLGTHSLVAGSITAGRPSLAASARRPTLRYADLRATGKTPRLIEGSALERRIAVLSLATVAAAGIPIVIRGITSGDHSLAADVVRYGGVPWLLAVLAMAGATRRWMNRDAPIAEALLLAATAGTISGGITAAAIATGGVLSPILFALFIKTLFDTVAMDRGRAAVSLVAVVIGWFVAATFSAPEALWVAPFHLALIGGCWAFGRIARATMAQTADFARDRAYTDELTQFSNRAGFLELAEEAFYRSVTETGQPFALITFHLDGLRVYNEAHGYAAGDALLRTIADLLEDRIPSYYVIGRTGSTTFSAAVAVGGSLAASGLAHDLCTEIRAHTTVRAGCATCPGDGATLAALMATSERDARRRSAAIAV